MYELSFYKYKLQRFPPCIAVSAVVNVLINHREHREAQRSTAKDTNFVFGSLNG